MFERYQKKIILNDSLKKSKKLNNYKNVFVNKKYVKTIEDLKQELNKKNEELQNAQQEINGFNDTKRELWGKNAKLDGERKKYLT